MKTGDFVRVLHGTEEGHIVRFLENDHVEIETSDGFSITVPARELVYVSTEETERFGGIAKAGTDTAKEASSEPQKPPPRVLETFLALVPETDGGLSMWLSNATECLVMYSLATLESEGARGIANGEVEAGSVQRIAGLRSAEVKASTICAFQVVFHPSDVGRCPSPVNSRLRPWHTVKDGSLRSLPSIDRRGYRVDLLDVAPAIDPEALRESLLEPSGRHDRPHPARDGGTSRVVDLHIEALTDQPEALHGPEILELQLRVFEKALDEAIAGNVKSVKFIHGVGNGTLRYRIHKRLSELKDVLYYRDADKQRFGFGATTIELK